jgi:hypothetical protein
VGLPPPVRMPPQKKSSVAKWKEKQKLERLEAKVKAKREEQRAMKALLEAEMDEESRQDNLGADEKEQELEAKKKKEARLKEATEMLKRYHPRHGLLPTSHPTPRPSKSTNTRAHWSLFPPFLLRSIHPSLPPPLPSSSPPFPCLAPSSPMSPKQFMQSGLRGLSPTPRIARHRSRSVDLNPEP